MKMLTKPEALGGDCVRKFNVCTSNNPKTISELDLYLKESLWPRLQEFDILSCWSDNQHPYTTLSKMASDILFMLVSTITRDSIFDTKTKRIDSSLPSATLQALICSRDWLRLK